MKFINLATLALESMFAPRATELGSMVDILGVGAIIRGESGIGKSEAVLALIERGYSLVADDVVKAMLLDGREVLCAPARELDAVTTWKFAASASSTWRPCSGSRPSARKKP